MHTGAQTHAALQLTEPQMLEGLHVGGLGLLSCRLIRAASCVLWSCMGFGILASRTNSQMLSPAMHVVVPLLSYAPEMLVVPRWISPHISSGLCFLSSWHAICTEECS